MTCEGGGGGQVKATIDHPEQAPLAVQFATKEARLRGTTAFKFFVSAGEADQIGPATVKIG